MRSNCSAVPVEIGAASDCVVAKILLGLLVAKVFQGVGPQQVAHGPERRGLLEPVQLGHRTHTDKCTKRNTQNISSRKNTIAHVKASAQRKKWHRHKLCMFISTATHTHEQIKYRSEGKEKQTRRAQKCILSERSISMATLTTQGGRRCHTSRFTMETLPLDEEVGSGVSSCVCLCILFSLYTCSVCAGLWYWCISGVLFFYEFSASTAQAGTKA